MDFTNRSVPAQTPAVESSTSGINIKRNSTSSNKSSDNGKWSRIAVLVGLAAVVILIIALIVMVSTNNNNNKIKKESTYVNTSELQAVFLNTGQVYFGNINSLNNNYLVLSNIYYLQTASTGTSGASTPTTTANGNVTLVKLGCELHKPQDQMLINRTQVTFWENLESSGQVAKAVAKYQSQNPKHTCVDQSTSAGTTSGTAAQNASGNNSSTTPTTKP
jgi:hypothetical protein